MDLPNSMRRISNRRSSLAEARLSRSRLDVPSQNRMLIQNEADSGPFGDIMYGRNSTATPSNSLNIGAVQNDFDTAGAAGDRFDNVTMVTIPDRRDEQPPPSVLPSSTTPSLHTSCHSPHMSNHDSPTESQLICQPIAEEEQERPKSIDLLSQQSTTTCCDTDPVISVCLQRTGYAAYKKGSPLKAITPRLAFVESEIGETERRQDTTSQQPSANTTSRNPTLSRNLSRYNIANARKLVTDTVYTSSPDPITVKKMVNRYVKYKPPASLNNQRNYSGVNDPAYEYVAYENKPKLSTGFCDVNSSVISLRHQVPTPNHCKCVESEDDQIEQSIGNCQGKQLQLQSKQSESKDFENHHPNLNRRQKKPNNFNEQEGNVVSHTNRCNRQAVNADNVISSKQPSKLRSNHQHAIQQVYKRVISPEYREEEQRKSCSEDCFADDDLSSVTSDEPQYQDSKYVDRWDVPSPPIYGPRPNSRENQYSAPRNKKRQNWFYDPPIPSPPPGLNNTSTDIPEADQKVLKMGNLARKTYTLRTALSLVTPPLHSPPSPAAVRGRGGGVAQVRKTGSVVNTTAEQTYMLPPPSQLNRAIPFINGNFSTVLPQNSTSVAPPTLKRALGGQLADNEYAGQNRRKPTKRVNHKPSVVYQKRMHPFDEIVQEHMNQPSPFSVDKSNESYNDIIGLDALSGDNGGSGLEWIGATQNYKYKQLKKLDHSLVEQLKEFQENQLELLDNVKLTNVMCDDIEPELQFGRRKKKSLNDVKLNSEYDDIECELQFSRRKKKNIKKAKLKTAKFLKKKRSLELKRES